MEAWHHKGVQASGNAMAHTQKPDFVFRRNGRVHLNRRGEGEGQFSRLLAAEVCASVVVMLDTPCSEVVWRALVTHSNRQFPRHFPSRASPCAITFQLESTFFGEELRQKIGFLYALNWVPFKQFSIFTHKTHGLGDASSFPTWRYTNNGHHKIHAQILMIPTVKWTRDVTRMLYCHLAKLFAGKEFHISFLGLFCRVVEVPVTPGCFATSLDTNWCLDFEKTCWSHLLVRRLG